MPDHLRLPHDYGMAPVGRNPHDAAFLAKTRARAFSLPDAVANLMHVISRFSPPSYVTFGGQQVPTGAGVVVSPAALAARLGIAQAPLAGGTAARSLMLDSMSKGLTGQAAERGVYSAALGRALSGGSPPPPSLATGEVLRLLRRGR